MYLKQCDTATNNHVNDQLLTNFVEDKQMTGFFDQKLMLYDAAAYASTYVK